MTKKLVLIIISAVLAVALIVAGALLIIKNTGDFTATIGSETVIAGDIVEIPLTLKNNSDMWGGQIIVNYDTNAFNFISCQNGEVFDECEHNDLDGSVAILVSESALENTDKNGTIVVIKLGVSESAKPGDYDISFDNETNFCDCDGELVEPILENGTIKIK